MMQTLNCSGFNAIKSINMNHVSLAGNFLNNNKTNFRNLTFGQFWRECYINNKVSLLLSLLLLSGISAPFSDGH